MSKLEELWDKNSDGTKLQRLRRAQAIGKTNDKILLRIL